MFINKEISFDFVSFNFFSVLLTEMSESEFTVLCRECGCFTEKSVLFTDFQSQTKKIKDHSFCDIVISDFDKKAISLDDLLIIIPEIFK